ncbi:MAG: T9SS type A sorting domain-containing protein [bacterium]|nr:T9SS type A sorting domain-containing protein [bacterium]
MKHQILVVFAALSVASICTAQFNVGMYTTTPLTEWCAGGTPLPDGTVGRIYWDVNNNGPDWTDPMPVVGGGFAQANFNTFVLNGESVGLEPGTFFFEENFTIATNTPQPSKYYVRVEDFWENTWTSRVITVVDGYQETDMAPWSCQRNCGVPPPDSIVISTPGGRNFLQPGQSYNDCWGFCDVRFATLCLGPLSEDEMPIVEFSPGCVGNGCHLNDYPAVVTILPPGWLYNPASHLWCAEMVATAGCANFLLTSILSAEQGTFNAMALDASVVLYWTTYSENNVAGYDVLRTVAGCETFEKVGNVEAVNSPAGSNYEFLDNGAVNGTSYVYTLETVNLDGSRDGWGTVVSATPSVEAGVITEFALHQNYPNPFNPTTKLVFDVMSQDFVTLTICNVMGQRVATLVNGTMAAGRHSVLFDGSNLSSGLYYYTVKVGKDFAATKKMLLLK